jgi:hypothetical protein
MCGMSASDTTVGYYDCMTGSLMTTSPATGFANAMKNVKQLGLSFGNANRYASGVALVGSNGTFTVTTFTITP